MWAEDLTFSLFFLVENSNSTRISRKLPFLLGALMIAFEKNQSQRGISYDFVKIFMFFNQIVTKSPNLPLKLDNFS